jgi:hypothetical protein
MSGADTLDFDLVMGDEHPVATEIARNWTLWKSARAEWEDRVAEVKKYTYATSTRETTNVQNDHSHSTHIPKITQIADNLEANYMSALNLTGDWLRFEGSNQDSETANKKRTVLAYLNTKNQLNNFSYDVGLCIRDWILTGNCFGYVEYVTEWHDDPVTGERKAGYIGPKLRRISPHDIVMNPFASEFKRAPKIIRSLKTMGELHRDAEENPELGYSMEIIDLMQKSRENLKQYTDSAIDKNAQASYDGFGSASQYFNSGYVEILEYYGDIYDTYNDEWLKNQVITVVDRRHVIRMEPLNTWDGNPPIFHCSWRQRPDNLWGMGPLDNLVGMQYYIDHLENARADAFDQMIDADRKIYGDVQVEYRGAAVDYHIAEGGDVQFLAPDTTILNADFAIQRKEQQMEEYAGAPKDAMGIRTPGEKTAFEVQQLQNAASRIFQSKITYFEENFLEPIVNAEIEVARRHIDAADLVRIVDEDFGVTEFINVTQADLQTSGKLIPVGARHFARQAALAQNLSQFMGALQQDPMMAQHFPAERLAKAWEDVLGFKRLELFQKYGRFEEELEMQQMQGAAEQVVRQQQEVPAAIAAAGTPQQGV